MHAYQHTELPICVLLRCPRDKTTGAAVLPRLRRNRLSELESDTGAAIADADEDLDGTIANGVLSRSRRRQPTVSLVAQEDIETPRAAAAKMAANTPVLVALSTGLLTAASAGPASMFAALSSGAASAAVDGAPGGSPLRSGQGRLPFPMMPPRPQPRHCGCRRATQAHCRW